MEYTKEQIIQFTISNLGAINVPAKYAEQIGVPIQKAIVNLEIVMAMFEKEKSNPAPEHEEEAEDGRETDAE